MLISLEIKDDENHDDKVESEKIRLDEITDENGYVNLNELGKKTRLDIRENFDEYLEMIFPQS
ncbi:MAG: hypothetical protein N2482_01380 [Patescibacteria group bacterium]|nr:hypothetical protein [Patescibacteria group bacterium]